MSTIRQAAEALADRIRASASLPAGAHVTTEPGQAFTAALGPAGGVLIGPPRLDWPGPAGTVDVTWTITVTARAPGSMTAAWDTLDALIDAVSDVVDLERAVPGSVPTPDGSASLPAYVLTAQPIYV